MIFASLKSYLPPAPFGVPYLALTVELAAPPAGGFPHASGTCSPYGTEEISSLPVRYFSVPTLALLSRKFESRRGHIPRR